jgi:acetylglutamate kinase
MDTEILCIKIGGRAAADPIAFHNCIDEIGELQDAFHIVIVHGGGAEVSKISEKFGIKTEFEDGIRMTGESEMDVVDMVLSGKVNKYLVRQLNRISIPAVGLCGADGGIFLGERLSEQTHTGRVSKVNPHLLRLLFNEGIVPVIAPTSADRAGTALNINADEVALSLATAIPAGRLIFISDIPGILKDGSVIKRLDPEGISSEISSGTITGGMIPKVKSAIQALKHGVSRIAIGNFEQKNDLRALLDGTKGTTIVEEVEK